MDIKDLKTAWEAYSSQEMDKHRFNKDKIAELFQSKTKSLVDLIDRNIRIGILVILIYIAYVVVDDLVLSRLIISEPFTYPSWMVPLDIFSNVVIIFTFLFFVFRYLRIKRSFSADLQLKALLTGILDTLTIYRRMFYLAVAILLLNMVVSFAAGLYQGIKIKADSVSGGIENLTTGRIIFVIGIGLAVLVPLIAGTFFLLRWGFNRLYGRYMHHLKNTLQELNETENQE
jgi:hypothetical protein